MRKFYYLSIATIALLLVFSSCRKGDNIIPSTQSQVIYPDPEIGEVKGFFLLNEGNMGSNKATLDYFDYRSGIYSKNIYAERNPSVIKELGDVGNDIQIHGDRLYAVINCSNLVEVMDLNTAEHIGAISIPNCRYITFKGRYAYVSSYAGPVQIDPNARLGYIAKVDTATLQVVDECLVGYQPEEMVIAGDKLYVANSGGYRVPNYDTRVSVIDLDTFKEVEKIEVAINLHRMELDRYGYIWVSSRGDYYDIASKVYVISSKTNDVVKELDIACNNMTRVGDSIYLHSTQWNHTTAENRVSYAIIDTKIQEVVTDNFISDGTQEGIKVPYGLAVNPETKEIFITDAKTYVNPGMLHCYSPEGILKWSVETGDIPAHIVFTNRALQ